MTITTFAKDRLQHLQNSSNSPQDEYELVEEKSYFTQGPEYVVIKVYLQATPIPSRDMGKLDADVLHTHGCIRLERFGTPPPTSSPPSSPPPYPLSSHPPHHPHSTLLLIPPPPPHLSLFPSFQIDHAVVASVFTDSRGRETLAASHRQLKGYLVDVDGDVIRELSPDPGKPDKAGTLIILTHRWWSSIPGALLMESCMLCFAALMIHRCSTRPSSFITLGPGFLAGYLVPPPPVPAILSPALPSPVPPSPPPPPPPPLPDIDKGADGGGWCCQSGSGV